MESMIKCKVFTPIDAYELEKEINKFAEEAAKMPLPEPYKESEEE